MSRTTTYITTGLLAAIAGGVIVYFFASKANDDDPIIMAGGSLHVYSHGGFNGKKGTAVHSQAKNYVTEVDVIAGDPLTFTSKTFSHQQVTISMPYCQTCPTADNVTFQTDGNGQNLTLTDAVGTIGDEAAQGKNEILHLPEQGQIQKITLAGQDYTCVTGHCYLIIHYCKNSNWQ